MSLAILERVTFNREYSWTNPRSCWEVISVNSPTFTDTFENILDQGLRGVGFKDFGANLGSGFSEVALDGFVNPEQIGYFLEAILGEADSDPDVAGRWHHVYNPDINCLVRSLSFEDYVPIGSANVAPVSGSAFRYSGMLCSNLTLKFNAGEGAVGWTGAFTGRTGTPAIKQAVPSNYYLLIGSPPFLGWEGSAHIGIADLRERKYSKLIDYEVSFSREVILEHVGNTTQQPGFGYVGPLETTMKATVDFSHEEDFALYRKNYQQEFGVTITKGNSYMSIVCPRVSWIDAPIEIDRSGGHLKASWSMRALYDPGTPNSPVKVILTNGTVNYLSVVD